MNLPSNYRQHDAEEVLVEAGDLICDVCQELDKDLPEQAQMINPKQSKT